MKCEKMKALSLLETTCGECGALIAADKAVKVRYCDDQGVGTMLVCRHCAEAQGFGLAAQRDKVAADDRATLRRIWWGIWLALATVFFTVLFGWRLAGGYWPW